MEVNRLRELHELSEMSRDAVTQKLRALLSQEKQLLGQIERVQKCMFDRSPSLIQGLSAARARWVKLKTKELNTSLANLRVQISQAEEENRLNFGRTQALDLLCKKVLAKRSRVLANKIHDQDILNNFAVNFSGNLKQ